MPDNIEDSKLEQIELINEIAYDSMVALLGRRLEWDIEWIAEIRDRLVEVAVEYFGENEEELLPTFNEVDDEDFIICPDEEDEYEYTTGWGDKVDL